MKLPRKLVFVTTLLLFMLLVLAFPFGPLFPWSPLKLGYHEINYARGAVFVGKATAPYGDYSQLDQLMNDAESFHQLSFKRRLRVIECKDWATCDRGLPWLNTHSLGGVTLWGDAIYITPKLKEKNFSVTEFLRHELSHAIIGQNTTMFKSYKLNDQPWFYEGLAVSFGRQHDYLQRDEFLAKAETTGLAQYLDPAQRPAEWNARFAYPTQRYFIEWLKATFGPPLFQEFLTRNIAAPEVWRVTFETVYHQPFLPVVQQYEAAVRAKSWPPAE